MKMTKALEKEIIAITGERYFKLKKSRFKTRIIALLFAAAAFGIHPVSVLIPEGTLQEYIIIFLVFCPFISVFLLYYSFRAKKYDVLEYVYFDKAVSEMNNKQKQCKPGSEKTGDKSSDNSAPVNDNENKPGTANVGKSEEKSETKMYKTKDLNNRISGCLTGGAVGDALGYPVEFLKYGQIVERFGGKGITEYATDGKTGKALISDDTQMTLFTAEGLQTDIKAERIYKAYLNWYKTQSKGFSGQEYLDSTLMNYRELYERRAPGHTCISALSSGIMGTVLNPINNSKGCGGIMRVAPVALVRSDDIFSLDKLAIQAAAVTHGHPLGYLPAGFLVHYLHRIIEDNSDSLLKITENSIAEFSELFSTAPMFDEMINLVKKAVKLSKNNKDDCTNIKELGEGWVAEETLAVSVYCALRHQNSFSEAVIASVNHDGDSDSTGAVTGNIIGAYLGADYIEEKWTEKLELYELISEFAEKFYA